MPTLFRYKKNNHQKLLVFRIPRGKNYDVQGLSPLFPIILTPLLELLFEELSKSVKYENFRILSKILESVIKEKKKLETSNFDRCLIFSYGTPCI